MRHREGVHPGLDGITRRMSRSETIPLTTFMIGGAFTVAIRDSGT
jgi:hypothetical protein